MSRSLNLLKKSLDLISYLFVGRFEADEIQGRSQFDLFSDFLFRAAQYSTLPIKGRTASRNKLIVVEDFPNTFYRNVDQFHNNILR